jgi:enamine deaminase RidA (YjgF/YER057c/UK114 family)
MTSKPRFLNPDTLSKPPGYTHVVDMAGPARIVYVAGQLALDRGGKIVGAGNFRAQAIQVFENLKFALAAVGAGMNDVVKINNYVLDMAHRPVFREVRDMYVNKAAPPASTLVGVTTLAYPEALIEIEAIALLPGG